MLHSIVQQGIEPNDRFLIIGDGPSIDLDVEDTIASLGWGSNFHFIQREHGGAKNWGHTQTNWGFDQLRDQVDIITAQDDDDIYAPRAFDLMRDAAEENPGHLLMSRATNGRWGILWREPDWDVALESWGAYSMCPAQAGHSVWFPGDAPTFPKLGDGYDGDQTYVQAARILFWDKTTWVNVVTSLAHGFEVLTETPLWFFRVELGTPQFDTLRRIRNECSDGMTGTTGEITKEMHLDWWSNRDPRTTHAWTFHKENDPTSPGVGFVVIRPYKDGQTGTIGVAKAYRRKGHGQELALFCTLAAQGPLIGEAFIDNPVLPLDYKAGWKQVGPPHNGLVDLECKWPASWLRLGTDVTPGTTIY